MFKLRPVQLASVGVIKWLFSNALDNRKTGRSMLIAIALLDVAKANKGTWVYAFDHSLTEKRNAKERVLSYAVGYAKEYMPKDVFEVDEERLGLRYLRTEPTIRVL